MKLEKGMCPQRVKICGKDEKYFVNFKITAPK
jgi:hypothetical protein